MGNMTGQMAVTYRESQPKLPFDGQHDRGKRQSPIRSPNWSSPLACTSKDSPPPSTGSTLNETLVSASAFRRSPILLPVKCEPSLPARGESFGPNIILHADHNNVTTSSTVHGSQQLFLVLHGVSWDDLHLHSLVCSASSQGHLKRLKNDIA